MVRRGSILKHTSNDQAGGLALVALVAWRSSRYSNTSEHVDCRHLASAGYRYRGGERSLSLWLSGLLRSSWTLSLQRNDVRNTTLLWFVYLKWNTFKLQLAIDRKLELVSLDPTKSRKVLLCTLGCSRRKRDRSISTSVAENASRSDISFLLIEFSNPSGINDFVDAFIVSMSSRSTCSSLPCELISRSALDDSPASIPVNDRPSVVRIW